MKTEILSGGAFQSVRVALDPFFLGKHELTQDQWFRMAGSTPSEFPAATLERLGLPARDLAAGRDRLGIAPEAFSTMAVGETRVVQPAPDQPAPVQPAPVQPARAARSPSDGANQ